MEPGSPSPSLREALPTWARIGVLSFGGPAGQIALMHRVLVEEKRWIDEQRFLTGLNFCMLLPGPEAMQLATYVGWRLNGVAGGLVAGLLFVLPGAALMLALALAYAHFGSVPVAEVLFLGVKAAVLAIVVQALLKLARKALHEPLDWAIAGAAFLGLFLFAVPFPVIVLAAALVGLLRANDVPAAATPALAPVPLGQTIRTVAIWTAVWMVPLFAVAAIFGHDHVLTHLAWLYSKLAVVTFGGAYAVLTFLAQEVVQTYGWLRPGEMLDALGLAETTPGPLILVTEFVGTLAAWRHGGGPPLAMGILAAAVSLWATFTPCFLWIFAGAPYVERLHHAPRLTSALKAITAAVVGVILNLSLWFAIHTLFRRVEVYEAFPLRIELPDPASLRWDAAVLAVFAAVLLLRLNLGILPALALTAAASFGINWLKLA